MPKTLRNQNSSSAFLRKYRSDKKKSILFSMNKFFYESLFYILFFLLISTNITAFIVTYNESLDSNLTEVCCRIWQPMQHGLFDDSCHCVDHPDALQIQKNVVVTGIKAERRVINFFLTKSSDGIFSEHAHRYLKMLVTISKKQFFTLGDINEIVKGLFSFTYLFLYHSIIIMFSPLNLQIRRKF